MRMWMVDERVLCRKHLLGEHVEHHMFLGTLKRKLSMDGYIKNNLLEVRSIKKRHDILVKEMERRGYNHKSPLLFSEADYSYLDDRTISTRVNTESSLHELLRRCPECRKRFNQLNETQTKMKQTI